MPTKLKHFRILLFFLFTASFVFSQSFKTKSGSLEAISGVLRYNVIFEFAEDMDIPSFDSESEFLNHYSKKVSKKDSEAGEKFKQRWFSYRTNLFEPKFIQEFNFFNLKEKQVTVASNISDAKYTMVVRTTCISPGGSNFFFKNNAWLRVYVRIYETGAPEKVLYATEAINVHSEGADKDIFNRILSAYAELGRGLSKHLSRKT
jgi:hypothetical protein